MNKHLMVIGTVVLLLAVGLSGCTEQSSYIRVNVDNHHYYAVGCKVYVGSLCYSSFIVPEHSHKSVDIDKSSLSEKNSYTITLEGGCGGETKEESVSVSGIVKRVDFDILSYSPPFDSFIILFAGKG